MFDTTRIKEQREFFFWEMTDNENFTPNPNNDKSFFEKKKVKRHVFLIDIKIKNSRYFIWYVFINQFNIYL
jgi:hypothetical protein